MKTKLKIIILFTALVYSSCKKFVEIEGPINKVNETQVFTRNDLAISAMTSIYYSISVLNSQRATFVGLFGGLSADEFQSFGVEPDDQYSNSLNANSSLVPFAYWTAAYENIFRANVMLEGLEASPMISDKIRSQLIGEAKFARAFQYFYLVNLYGAVPLVQSSDYKKTVSLPRSAPEEVYASIIGDLTQARELLGKDYLNNELQLTSQSKLRPNYWAATALLARVYLYRKDWTKAEQLSTEIIGSGKFSLKDNLDEVFLKNSTETIWELEPVGQRAKTVEAKTFLLTTPPNFEKPYALSPSLVSSFDQVDERRTHWIGTFTDTDPNPAIDYHFARKYKLEDPDAEIMEFSVVLRLAEQYLIRAEARAQLGKLTGTGSSQADINAVRTRAGLTGTPAEDLAEMLLAIENERKFELFTEWGDRWLDLKRTGRVDAIMPSAAIAKGGSWEQTDKLFPIPFSEINRNPNLKPQNPGY
ncbi:RagB/SusD family nutrient uptake outer membrane protein [Pedobacter sp. KBW01]|uniref:RagB/SusD family nutrient uptake outer membrane protein n=1 Tax=Pedobacter sp. KBW01 TaxID=2153364 RepID=UPI000F5B25C0|nr:RagB/SusD family nutrient uptake outer membrane protein [Pedobacter sp. KBW01]RQO77774.1 RagB/SusD family nutrient uptake outer membrane protein [Pedobacter sp. KBW01]